MPTVRCSMCGKTVPSGAFCGNCGANLTPQRGGGPAWLRMRTYAVAPAEAVLRPSVVSSLLPRLPRPSRGAFRAVLVGLLVALVIVAVLRWQAPLIAISALGLLMCFVMYLKDSDVFTDMPLGGLLLAALTGLGLGVGWAVLTGTVLARTYIVALGAGMLQGRPLGQGLAIVLGGTVLMVLPAVLVRISRPQSRESLDGFVIGSLGALCFTAGATVILLAPQLATGLVTRERPVSGLLVEAGIQGIAIPTIAAAVGGMVGTTLWFKRRADDPQRHRSRAVAILVLVLAVVLIVYGGLGLIDIAGLRQALQLGLYIVLAVFALLALRTVVQAALVQEAHDDMSPDQPVLCTECGYVVPDAAFCAQCGMAASASSRSSRTARRLARPVPIDPTAEGS
jgi:hypothetical protein